MFARIFLLLSVWLLAQPFFSDAAYNLGVGIYDVTGPSVEINFMGYANPLQRGEGIHTRLRARSFVAQDPDTKKLIAFVNVDGGMGSDLVNQMVVEKLNQKVQGVFSIENVCISGTHTHSGPAGFLQYVLYQVTSLGYFKETLNAWVDGITESILMAYNNMQPSVSVMFAEKGLTGANINRSPTSYLLNPEEERNLYPEGDTDKNMMLLKFVSSAAADKKVIGSFNWFAVHCTSMNNTNTFVSADNKGYAELALEKDMNGPSSLPGTGPFVGAFCSSNLGDVSPNTAGPKCIDTGLPCDGSTSTCNGKCEKCIAFGPGTNGDMFESTQIIGDKQYKHAKALMDAANEEITGPIDYRHSFVDMSTLEVVTTDASGNPVKKTLCSPAMGYAFAAGTTDGPGMFKFTQGEKTSNPFWNKVRDFITEKPSKEQIECHRPKPILLNTGEATFPYEWDPKIVPLQIMRLGNFFIVAVPSEFTTMSGRRLRKTISSILEKEHAVAPGVPIHITISGLANGYSSYVTTFEEYQGQRYEAASTIFGPHTLDGYLQELSRLATDLAQGKPSTTGPPTPDLRDVMWELMPPVIFDRCPSNTTYGAVVANEGPKPAYKVGETVSVTFHSGNPRNNPRPQGTFLTVEKANDASAKTFTVIATDGNWETKFKWWAGMEDKEHLGLSPVSYANVMWTIPSDTPAGTYRVCHQGDHKAITGKITPFSGCSDTFQVQTN